MMSDELDEIDRRLLAELQRDATLSVDELSERVSLSRNACWRRVKLMEERGVITGRVALVDPEKLGLGLSVFVIIRTSSHDPDWLRKFREAVTSFPEITGVYRMSGDLDYVLRARVADVKAYDRLYQRLIAKVPLSDVSATALADPRTAIVEDDLVAYVNETSDTYDALCLDIDNGPGWTVTESNRRLYEPPAAIATRVSP
jgi:Lrp/AsnC family transcriptional regulator